MERLRAVEREGLKANLPAFDPGDTVRVMVRVREGDKERLQAFEGVCIGRRGAGINATFTVRKISAGVGVERIFPLHAPSIAEIELVRKGRVRRAKLYFLRRLAGVGAASVREIDRLNIRRASILAMERALARLGLTPDLVLVDGLPCPELGRVHEAIVDGDAHCHSIAAASVIAKTVRDRLMELLASRHPTYAWASNKGYATPDHLAALAAFGFTSHHRKSFAPVVQLELMASPASVPS